MTKYAKGFVTMMTVLLIAVMAVSVVIGMLYATTSGLQADAARFARVHAAAYADACGEMGLHAMALDDSYTGSQTLTFTQGSCSYTVTGTLPKIMTVTGTSNGVVAERRIEKNLSGVTWQVE